MVEPESGAIIQYEAREGRQPPRPHHASAHWRCSIGFSLAPVGVRGRLAGRILHLTYLPASKQHSGKEYEISSEEEKESSSGELW